MSDISNQLIKDSYNYVLQSDLSSGTVYRIGGTIPVNPKFLSGLTVMEKFIYSDGTEQPNYALLTDGTGLAFWGPISAATPSSGVTSVTAGFGLSGDVTTGSVTLINTSPDQTVTISGGTGITTGGTYPNFTILNSAPDQTVTISGGTGITTGGTYPNFTIVNSAPDRTVTLTGGTNIQITGTYPDFGVNYTGTTIVQGITGITGTSGVSASTTDYVTTIINTSPDQTVTLTGGTSIQITGTYPNFGVNFTGSTGTSGDYLPLSGGTVTGGTIFQSGLTANTISATTYQNLPQDVFVTGGTYTAGSATFTNTTGGTFSVTGFPVGGGGGQTFYLNLSQTQNGDRLLSTTASTASEQMSGVTINNGVTSTIASFQSQPLNITLLPGGVWSFYLHSYKEDNNATFNIFVEVYKRTSGGTETLLFATDPTAVTTNSPNPSMQLSDGYFSGTSLNVSDSVVAVVRATNNGNQSHTITLVTEGSSHYSYVVSTIPTQQGLTCETLSGCSIIQTIQTNITNKFDKSGGTVTGGTVFQSGLTANTFYSSGQVGIGTSNPNAAAIIEIASTTQGVLFPRMTKVQRDAITSPPIGLMLFVTDDNEGLYIYKTSGWVQII